MRGWVWMCFLLCGVSCSNPSPSEKVEEAPQKPAPHAHQAFEVSPYIEPLPEPEPGDWLTEHPEPGQSFEAFQNSPKNLPSGTRRVIYLAPMGTFDASSPALDQLEAFTAAYFGLEVRVLPVAPIASKFTQRIHPETGELQLYTADILKHLVEHLPEDAYCMLGITMVDLYPHPDWNFVFGQALLQGRVGIFSFARYASKPSRLVERSFKILAHETGHMFGMEHCTHHHCVMNGSNHLEESDSQPLHLCPVCLRKLHHSVGFDVVERYARLEAITRMSGLSSWAGWYQKQRAWIAPK